MGTKKNFLDANGNIIEDLLCVEEDSHGLMCPEDKVKLAGIEDGANKYIHPTYTARTGKPTGNQTPAFGGTATVSQITSNGTGHVTGATDRTITIPSTLSNGTGTAGLIKTTSTVTDVSAGYNACPVVNGVPYYGDTHLVQQNEISTNTNAPILLASVASTLRGLTWFDSGVTVNPSTNTITATTFKGAATSANKVNNNLAIKLNSGTTEGTNLFTFNGSAAKTINITPSIIGAAESTHTHSNYAESSHSHSNYAVSDHTHSYLPLSGGTLTGALTMGSAKYIYCNDASGTSRLSFGINGSNNLVVGYDQAQKKNGNTLIYGGGSTSTLGGIVFYVPNLNASSGVCGAALWNSTSELNCYFRPLIDGDGGLGSTGYRWYRVYQSASSVSTSDEREKSDIMAIEDYPVTYSEDNSGNVFEKLFSKLIPKTYTLDIEKSDELHIGFIAQDIEKSIEELGLTVDDLGLIDHGYWTDDETGEERDRYGLAYEEFTALNTYMIQKQQTKIETQESIIEEQQTKINNLEERITKLEALLINE